MKCQAFCWKNESAFHPVWTATPPLTALESWVRRPALFITFTLGPYGRVLGIQRRLSLGACVQCLGRIDPKDLHAGTARMLLAARAVLPGRILVRGSVWNVRA
jgi:hypothetical protein